MAACDQKCFGNKKNGAFTVQVMEGWHKLPSEAVELPCNLQKLPGQGPGHPALSVPA